MSFLHAFITNLQRYSCQSLSFSFGHNVLVNLGLNLLIALTIPNLTNEMKPQNIIPRFTYVFKKKVCKD